MLLLLLVGLLLGRVFVLLLLVVTGPCSCCGTSAAPCNLLTLVLRLLLAGAAAADPAAAAAMGSSADGAAVEAAPKKKSGSLAKRVVFGVILGLSGAAVIIIGGWVYAGVACLAAFQLSQVRRLRSRGMAAAGMAALPQCRCQQKLLALMLWRTALRRRCRAQVLCFLVNWRPPLPCLNHPFINRSTLVW